MLALPKLLSTTASRVIQPQLLARLCPLLSFAISLPIAPPIPTWKGRMDHFSAVSKFPLLFLQTTPDTKLSHASTTSGQTKNIATLMMLLRRWPTSPTILPNTSHPSLQTSLLITRSVLALSSITIKLVFLCALSAVFVELKQLWLTCHQLSCPQNLSSLRRSQCTPTTTIFLPYFYPFTTSVNWDRILTYVETKASRESRSPCSNDDTIRVTCGHGTAFFSESRSWNPSDSMNEFHSSPQLSLWMNESGEEVRVNENLT